MPSQKLKKKAKKLFEQKKLGPAKKLYQQLLHNDKKDIESWLWLGAVHGKLSESAQAVNCFKQAISLKPDFAEAYFNLGLALNQQGQSNEACQAYHQAILLRPNWIQAMNNLAKLLQAQEKYNDALSWYQQALNIDPTYVEALIQQSNIFALTGGKAKAIDGYRRALALAPNNSDCHRIYCRSLYEAGRFDEAMQAYEQMAQAFPDNSEPLASKARLLELTGDKAGASTILEALIAQHPHNPFVAIAYANITHPVEQSPKRIELLEKTLHDNQANLDVKTRSRIHYILGKLYDKTRQFDKAFPHFQLANQLTQQPFSTQIHKQQINEIIECHSVSALNNMPKVSGAGKKAVFIVGMPRSGTSLTEQILASHQAISGAGELKEIFDITSEISTRLDNHPHYPAFMPQLTDELCQEMAQRYQQKLLQISNTSQYVTDKMPQNFYYLGLISRLFPEAHIIHCQRDPRDTCLSCYFQNFSNRHNYSNRLDTLVHYYKQYQRLMQHWQKVLDIPILQIQYEALVSTPDATIKTMLDFLGLEWDDNCLNFHNNVRVINTASYDQVRQPINQNSVGRWHHYEKDIQPLLDDLGLTN